jgi:uncharacterized membrane protein
MPTHRDQHTFTCPVCGMDKPARSGVHGEMVRPAVAALVEKEHAGWTSGDLICTDCLNRYRTKYIEDVLETDRGELSKLDEDVIASLREQEFLSTDLNAEFDRQLTLGQRIADKVADFGGSWTFIGLFGVVMVIWMAINSAAALHKPFDPYPFILLNLVLSCMAAIQAPVIMMSQNRQEAKDRLHSENDYRVNLKAELEVRHLNEKMDLLLSRQWNRLIEIQRIQVDLMEELTRQRRP